MPYIIQNGKPLEYAYALRPVVSINLRTSGYSLEKQVDESNNVSFKLTK